MTVKKFLETMWKSYQEFVIVKNGCLYKCNVLDIAVFIQYRELLECNIDHINIEYGMLYIYCC